MPAGSVVEIHGGISQPYRQSQNGLYQIKIIANGSEERPIFFRGSSLNNKPIFDMDIQVQGQYIIIENIFLDSISERHDVKLATRQDGVHQSLNHAAIRHSEFNRRLRTGGSQIGIGTSGDNSVFNIVIYNNSIYNAGDWQLPPEFGDSDGQGIGVDPQAEHVWILDNEIYYCSGNAVQINGGNDAPVDSPNYIYIGRNRVHHNRQSGLWTKGANDVIFSENILWGHRSTSAGGWGHGGGIGWQYYPRRVWVLFNHVYDNSKGIATGSAGGEDYYIIGNRIYDILEAGIRFYSNPTIDIIGNTIYNAFDGIKIDGGATAPFNAYNNIIANVSNRHIDVVEGAASDLSIVNNNLFYQQDGAINIWWDSSSYDLLGFQGIGKGINCIEANPLFVDAANNDFHLQPASPAIDNGTLSDVYQTFSNLYGIDISVDFDGSPVPQGFAPDIGAYEYVLDPQSIPYSQAVPYMQDFSLGKPTGSQGWEYYSNNEGRIEVVGGRLRMDDTSDNSTFSQNEAILHVDLTGKTNVTLTLDHWSLGDES
ncbi:MAG: right-handed parallel beta-helix repeat-containing protein, partial [Thermoplasmata archaeon]